MEPVENAHRPIVRPFPPLIESPLSPSRRNPASDIEKPQVKGLTSHSCESVPRVPDPQMGAARPATGSPSKPIHNGCFAATKDPSAGRWLSTPAGVHGSVSEADTVVSRDLSTDVESLVETRGNRQVPEPELREKGCETGFRLHTQEPRPRRDVMWPACG